MTSESRQKEWWEDRTFDSLKGTPVKVVFTNGDTLTGTLDGDGDVTYGDDRWTLALYDDDDGHVCLSNGIARLERRMFLSDMTLIKDFDQLRVGDIVEMDNGNQHNVTLIRGNGTIDISVMPGRGISIGKEHFVRGFRPQLPYLDGIYEDRLFDLYFLSEYIWRRLSQNGKWVAHRGFDASDRIAQQTLIDLARSRRSLVQAATMSEQRNPFCGRPGGLITKDEA